MFITAIGMENKTQQSIDFKLPTIKSHISRWILAYVIQNIEFLNTLLALYNFNFILFCCQYKHIY